MLKPDELRAIRAKSHAEATRLGYSTNPMLPLLETSIAVRPIAEIATRMLCIVAISFAAHDFSRPKALKWPAGQQLMESLAPSESTFLEGGGGVATMQCRVDALYALAWAMQIQEKSNFEMECPESLAGSLPNLEIAGSVVAFRQKVSIRSAHEIIAMADLAYCLHWSIRDSILRRQRPPGRLHPIYVIERRRAFEWLIGKDGWDDVKLDT
jgi:hypothetical protein